MTVLIADDNALIRNWLKIMLQQLEGGELRLLEARDGDEALELCLSQPVDLLITDIKMPGQDGITLIKTLRGLRPDLRAAVLSSYDDFEYVRIALQCGALDYILKAEMKQEDITSLMQKVRDSLSLSRSPAYRLDRHREIIQAAQTAYRDYTRDRSASADTLLSACGLDPEASRCCLTLLIIRDHTPGIGALQVAELCCNTLKIEGRTGVAFPLEGESYLMLYALGDETLPQQQELHLRLLSALTQNLSVSRTGQLLQNVNVIFNRGENFSQKLRYARELVEFQIYYNSAALPAGDGSGLWDTERTFLKNLQALVNIPDYGRACYLLQKYVAECHTARELPHRIHRTVTAVLQMMLGVLPPDSRQSEEHRALDRLAQEIGDAKTAELLRRRVNQFCTAYLACTSRLQAVTSPAIARAVSYCNENYARKVSLEELAALVRLNKSYFSQLFHKEMGTSFGDYLESVRIKNAQQLLRDTNYSMADVAEKVGFANQNYFTKVFKKATGLTPSQYKTAVHKL